MAKKTRSLTWSLVSYASKEELQQLYDNCLHFAYCYHDRDTKEDGSLFEPHTHIIVKFESLKTLDQIKTTINSQQNTLGECQRQVKGKDGRIEWAELNITGLYRYLIHQDDKDKYQYEAEERITDSTEYWSKYSGEQFTRDKSDNLIEDLLKPYKSQYELDIYMSNTYGRDYIKNRLRYLEFRYDIIAEELRYIEYEDFKTQETLDNELITERFNKYNRLITFLEEYEISPKEAYAIIFNHTVCERSLNVRNRQQST